MTSSELLRFDGRVAIVTGAGRGIGRSIALRLAARGAKVVVNDLGTSVAGEGVDSQPADEVVKEIVDLGGDAVAAVASVATSDGADTIARMALERYGTIDVLVNNAGISRNRIIHKMSVDEWDGVLKTHLYGAFYCMRAVLPTMRERTYGRIINMTSTSALIGAVGQANYMAAKAGIIGLTRGAALDLNRHNVLANCVSPSAATRLVGVLPTEVQAARGAANQLSAEDVADVVLWLGSQESSLSGQVIGVRGREIHLYNQSRPCWTLVKSPDLTESDLIAALRGLDKFATPLEQTTDYFDYEPLV